MRKKDEANPVLLLATRAVKMELQAIAKGLRHSLYFRSIRALL